MTASSHWESVAKDPVIWMAGMALLGTQSLFYVLCRFVLPSGPWKDSPSFTAHQVVALGLMIYCTYTGITLWFFSDGNDKEQNELLPFSDVFCPGTDRGEGYGALTLSKVMVGAMLLWDIPTGLAVDGLTGNPIMQLHHVGLLLVSSIAMGNMTDGVPMATCYAPFFFGVIEISSIPLAIVDLFHPKQKSWHQFHLQYAFLRHFNEICRILFALLYILTRGLYFPFVIVTDAFPNIFYGFRLASSSSSGVVFPRGSQGALLGLSIFCILFTILQLYWGALVVRQVYKVLFGNNKAETETKPQPEKAIKQS